MNKVALSTVEILERIIDRKIENAINSYKRNNTLHRGVEILRKDNEGTIWVHIPGGAEETPVDLSYIDGSPGDIATLRFENGLTILEGNTSNIPISRSNYYRETGNAIGSATASINNNLVNNYAHVTNGIIDNAGIDYLKVKNLDTNYAHITDGVIDNAKIDHADVNELYSNYAHIDNGVINNATIDHANVNDLDANYAHITDGVIDNATIDHADVNDLDANYAHIVDGVIDNATIGYADVNNLNAHYAEIDMANVNNEWVANGTIKNAAITNEMVHSVSANKLTVGTIDASKINVANLRAKNLIVEKLNGQPVLGGYELVNSGMSGYASKNPKSLGWYEYNNGVWVKSDDTLVDSSKAYYIDSDQVALYDQDYIDRLQNELNQRIDGAVETFTGTAIPTMLNYPVADWESSQYGSHVGDIYYVTDPTSNSNGYCYRFAYDSTSQSYGWVLIKDSDVTKALFDISYLQTFESETTSWIEETDEGIRTIRQNHTELSGVVDKTLVESIQLWFSKANTTAPSKPTSVVSSTSTAGNAWRTVVPAYNASYPNYFYCYQWKYVDGSYEWSSVTRDIAMGEVQFQARSAASSIASYITSNDAALQSLQEQVDGAVDIWYGSADPTSSTKPWLSGDDDSIHVGDLYYNTENGHAFRYVASDSSYVWTQLPDSDAAAALAAAQDAQATADGKRRIFTVTPTAPYDKGDLWVNGSEVRYANVARTESQGYNESDWLLTATDDTMAKANIKSSVMLWFSKANATAPAKPTAQVTSTSTSGNAWRLVVPTYNASYPHYFYCYQQLKGDGTYQWTDVVYDRATTETQSTSRAASSSIASYITSNNQAIADLQNQIDGAVDIWYGSADPESSTIPWDSGDDNDMHVGDMYVNTSNGHSFRYTKSGSTYSWEQIPESDASIALAAAQDAQATADGKRRIFTVTPTAPYDKGDLWVNGSTVKYATAAKTSSQSYAASDWSLTATDDTMAKANIKSSVMLWFTKVNATAPSKPTAVVTSTATTGNAWTTKVPEYDVHYPYYFYCYQQQKGDGTYQWTDVVYDRGTTETQSTARAASSSLANYISTNDAAVSSLQNQIDNAVDIWYGSADPTTSTKPWPSGDDDSIHVGDMYYNTSNGHSFRYVASGSSYSWEQIPESDASIALAAAQDAQATADGKRRVFTSQPTVPYDVGDLWVTGSTVKYANKKRESGSYTASEWSLTATDDTAADAAQATANKNVKSSIQLWYTKANETAPSKPTTKVTSTATTGGAWRTVVPAYSTSYPNYFYCWQYELADGTYTWSDVVLDKATGETQAKSSAALPASTFTSFQSTTFKELVDEVDEQSSTITTMSEKISTTARNLLNAALRPQVGSVKTSRGDNDSFRAEGKWYVFNAESTLTRTEAGIRIDHAGGAAGGIVIPLIDDDILADGETLTLSFNYRGNHTSLGSVYLLCSPTPNVNQGTTVALDNSGEWAHYEYSWEYKANANVPWAILISYYNSAGKWLEIRDGSMILERGAVIVTTLTNTVNEVKQTADANSASITGLTTVTETLRGDLDGLEIGGRNLLRHTDDLDNATWWNHSATSVTAGQADPDGGTGAFLSTPTNSGWYLSSKNVNCLLKKVGAEYTASVWLRADSETTCNVCVRYLKSDYSDSANTTRMTVTVPTTWMRFEVTGTLMTAQTSDCFWVGQKTTEPIYVYHPKVEKGNRATDWTPAPEDVDAAINTVSETVTSNYNTLTQTLDATESRVGKTESQLVTVANPNLSPFFERPNSDLYSDGNGGYWKSSNANALFTEWDFAQSVQGSGGWARIVGNNTGSSSVYAYFYVSRYFEELKPETDYTFLVEWRDVSLTGSATIQCPTAHNGTNGTNHDFFSATASTSITAGDGEKYVEATTRAEYESGCLNLVRGQILLHAGASISGYIRLSLYEGSYSGPYKPYVDPTLSSRVTQAETAIVQNSDAISLRATKAEASQMGQPNLSPFFEYVPFGVTNSTYWISSFSEAAFTALDDGWAHFKRSNTGSSVINSYFRMVASPAVKQGEEYTCLVEIRDIMTNTATSNSLYVQQSTDAQFWGNGGTNGYSSSGDGFQIINSSLSEGAHYFPMKARGVSDHGSTGLHLIDFNWQVPAGAEIECDIRISLYKGTYSGPWKPYSGPQLYSSQAELRVANDEISSKVSKNGVISSINQSAESITIDADKVNIAGAALFTSGRLSTTSLNSAYDAKGAAATAETNAKEYADGIVIGGTNLVTGSESMQTWRAGSLVSVEDGIATMNGNSSNWNAELTSPKFDAELYDGTTEYIYSFDYKSTADCSILCVIAGSALPVSSLTWSRTKYCNWDGYITLPSTDGEWTRYCLGARTIAISQLTSGSGEVVSGYIQLYARSNVTIYVRHCQLEAGNKPTSWSPAPEDHMAMALSAGVEYIEGTQTAKTGNWTGVTRETTLMSGKTIAYKLPYAGDGNASLQLKDSNGNNVGGNIAIYTNTTRVTTHFGAGAVINMTYDGTYWRTNSIPNTNNYDRRLHNNYIKAAGAVASGALACGTSSGYKQLAASVEFDLSYPILWAGAAWTNGTQYANAYEAYPSVNIATTLAVANIPDIAANATVYVKGTVSGNTFKCASANFLTCRVSTEEDGIFYIPIGMLANDYTSSATNKLYFSTSKDLYAYIDGSFRQVNPASIIATQKIYYRTSSSTEPSGSGLPASWVTETGNKWSANSTTASNWTKKVTPIANGTGSSVDKYLYLWTCEQRKRLDGTVKYGEITLDDSTTVIDGGNIITNSIDANKIKTRSLTIGYLTEAVQNQITNGDAAYSSISGFTILWNYSAFSTSNNGKAYICKLDPKTRAKSDANGTVMWNSKTRTVPKGMINPNALVPYNRPVYVVLRLSDSSDTTGTNYVVWYDSGWKHLSKGIDAATTDQAVEDWTWVDATDIVLGMFVETGSEAALTDCIVYDPPWSSKQVSIDVVTARSANAAAASAQTTANTANNRHTAYRGTCSTSAGTAAKTVTCTGFALASGATVEVYCSTANTANVPTLNVNSTGAKAIWVNGEASSASNPCKWLAGDTVTFTYDGTRFRASLPVENYITADSTGINVHKASDTSNYLRLTSDGTDVVKGNESVALFGETCRVGKVDSYHAVLDSNGMDVSNPSGDNVISISGGSGGGTVTFSPYAEPSAYISGNAVTSTSGSTTTNTSTITISSANKSSITTGSSTDHDCYIRETANDSQSKIEFKAFRGRNVSEASVTVLAESTSKVDISAGAVTFNSHSPFKVVEVSSTATIAANSGYSFSITPTTQTGYTPIGVIGAYNNHTYICTIGAMYFNGTKACVDITNRSAASTSVTCTVQVLYTSIK